MATLTPISGAKDDKQNKLVKTFGRAEVVNANCPSINHTTANININSSAFPAWYSALLKTPGGEGFIMTVLRKKYSEAEIVAALERVDLSGIKTCNDINKSMELGSKCGKCPHAGKIITPSQLRGVRYYTSEAADFFAPGLDKNKPAKILPHTEELKEKVIEDLDLICVDNHAKPLYRYTGKFWEPISHLYVASHINILTKNQVLDRDRQEVIKAICSERRILRDENWFNESIAGKVNFPNGVFDFGLMKLVPHDRKYGFLSVMDYEYDSSAKTDRFYDFLIELSCGDMEWVKMMTEIIGLTLVPGPNKTGKAFWFYGELSRNGKGTLCKLIQSLLPKNISTSIRLENLGDESYLIKLLNSQMNFSDEANSIHPNKMIGLASTVSSLITGDAMDIRGKFRRDAVALENRARMFFTSNEIPKMEALKGLDSRIIFIPFDAVFKEGVNQDKNIMEKLLVERSGIFNLAIAGYHRLKDQSFLFSNCQRIAETTKEVKDNKDMHIQWINERLTFEEGAETSKNYLREQYLKDMQERGERWPLNEAHFGRYLAKVFNLRRADLEYRKRHGVERIRFVKNIRFKAIDED